MNPLEAPTSRTALANRARHGSQHYLTVPAATILILLEPLIKERGISWVAASMRIGHRGLLDLRTGRRLSVTFRTADDIICHTLGHPELWYEIPELRAIYEQAGQVGTAA